MPFGYYDRLSEPDRAAYRASDSVRAIRLHEPATLAPLATAVRESLPSEDPVRVTLAVQALCDGLAERLGIMPVETDVLAVRPRSAWAELHGLYTREEGSLPHLYVWMRTARHARVVAFRTFLRTVLHELCHHLDVELLRLPRSFHTEGFFKRESSLFHQLVPDAPRRRRPRA